MCKIEKAEPSEKECPIDKTAIGKRIRARRGELGLSQEALAERTGLSSLAIRNIEQGNECMLSTFIAISFALKSSVLYLLFGAQDHQLDAFSALHLLPMQINADTGFLTDFLNLLAKYRIGTTEQKI